MVKIADKAAGASLQRIPGKMKQLVDQIKTFCAQGQNNLWLVLRYLADLNTCRTDLIRKATPKNPEVHLTDHPLKLAMGEEARDAMIGYTPANPMELVQGTLDESFCKCFLMGSHLVCKMWIWLSMLEWPEAETWNTALASWGISFLELLVMINFSQCSGMAIPLTLEGKGSHKT